MSMVFLFIVALHAERPAGAPHCAFKRVQIREYDKADPIWKSLEQIFPNFHSPKTRKLDVGLYKFAKELWRNLASVEERRRFLHALECTIHDPDSDAQGMYYNDLNAITLKSIRSRSSRTALAHELQHAFDYIARPYATNPRINPFATVFKEWRAAMAEARLFKLAYKRTELIEEWLGADRRVKTEIDPKPDRFARFKTLRGSVYAPRDYVDLDDEDVEALDWRTEVSFQLDWTPRFTATLRMLGYLKPIFMNLLLHPVTIGTTVVCELALLGIIPGSG